MTIIFDVIVVQLAVRQFAAALDRRVPAAVQLGRELEQARSQQPGAVLPFRPRGRPRRVGR